MKIFTMCMECQKELGHPSFEPILADYYDEPVAHFECGRGHICALMLQSQKFEILLESAVNALLAGYTLEASSTFSSAYERFFEFVISVFCSKQKVDKDELAKTFKQVSRQSERQLGAFLYLYLMEFGVNYQINMDIIEFRNKVIHKGYIPSPDEVEKFAEKIYTEIYQVTQKLKSSCGEDIQNVVQASLLERSKSVSGQVAKATSTGASFFSLSHEEQAPTFDSAIASYKEVQKAIKESTPTLKALGEIIKAREH
ncbi:hypothetical protein [Microbulbifer agarilyticus]|uniref:hypothetical protein n=1 Tax=Microbulbifer agarilyticus TaxID=260552 RepID=UPI001CD63A40|nr:hypothetical protein [Microbulbifer agarilyticus]MCA0894907.1 hypothetical protein [Microbulbifer agarilyticus]